MTTIKFDYKSSKELDQKQEFYTFYALSQLKDSSYSAIRDLLEREEGYGSYNGGITQKKIAERLRKSVTWVSRKLSSPNESTLKTLATFAGGYQRRLVVAFVKGENEAEILKAIKILDHNEEIEIKASIEEVVLRRVFVELNAKSKTNTGITDVSWASKFLSNNILSLGE